MKRFSHTYRNYEATIYRATGRVTKSGAREYLSLTDVSLELTEKVVLNVKSDADYLLRLEDNEIPDNLETDFDKCLQKNKPELIVPVSLAEIGMLAGHTLSEQTRQKKLNENIQALVYASEIYENGAIKMSICEEDNSLYGYSRRDMKRALVIIPMVG